MTAGLVFAPARPVRRVATCITAVAALALGTSFALAQPSPSRRFRRRRQPRARCAPKQQPKQPQQPAQQAPAAPAEQQQARRRTSRRSSIRRGPSSAARTTTTRRKEVCLTVKEARLETGQFLAGAALIEQAGEEKKLFRITLPLGMQLPQGTRMLLDKEQPLQGRYIVCLPNGCMADFDVNQEFVGKLKKGQQLVLQGINLPGQAASYMLPLADFAKANEGPPTDPKKFEEDQKKLQDELQKKAEEARKRLQAEPAGRAEEIAAIYPR